ncbi:hypothetical protein BCAR13_1280006 [Paraburkholderia caribensis]|nr:hypothetical protein BCAR13_1280006 [Paraburkholderia caribensis]
MNRLLKGIGGTLSDMPVCEPDSAENGHDAMLRRYRKSGIGMQRVVQQRRRHRVGIGGLRVVETLLRQIDHADGGVDQLVEAIQQRAARADLAGSRRLSTRLTVRLTVRMPVQLRDQRFRRLQVRNRLMVVLDRHQRVAARADQQAAVVIRKLGLAADPGQFVGNALQASRHLLVERGCALPQIGVFGEQLGLVERGNAVHRGRLVVW